MKKEDLQGALLARSFDVGKFGLGTMATQAANNVSITGGSITGVILDGGTF